MINRIIKDSIIADFRRKKVILLLGARQVGKTTLLSELQKEKDKILSLNCDNTDDILLLEGKTSTELKELLSPYDLVFIDEAQRVKNIGLTLKIIGDLKLNTQVVVTGSSSLSMADEINEQANEKLEDDAATAENVNERNVLMEAEKRTDAVESKTKANELKKSASENLKKYLEMKPDCEDKATIEELIKECDDSINVKDDTLSKAEEE